MALSGLYLLQCWFFEAAAGVVGLWRCQACCTLWRGTLNTIAPASPSHNLISSNKTQFWSRCLKRKSSAEFDNKNSQFFPRNNFLKLFAYSSNCLDAIDLKVLIWPVHANFGKLVKLKELFEKYMKEDYFLDGFWQLTFKYFLKYTMIGKICTLFVRPAGLSGSNWVKTFLPIIDLES